jgi:hypothetical protein
VCERWRVGCHSLASCSPPWLWPSHLKRGAPPPPPPFRETPLSKYRSCYHKSLSYSVNSTHTHTHTHTPWRKALQLGGCISAGESGTDFDHAFAMHQSCGCKPWTRYVREPHSCTQPRPRGGHGGQDTHQWTWAQPPRPPTWEIVHTHGQSLSSSRFRRTMELDVPHSRRLLLGRGLAHWEVSPGVRGAPNSDCQVGQYTGDCLHATIHHYTYTYSTRRSKRVVPMGGLLQHHSAQPSPPPQSTCPFCRTTGRQGYGVRAPRAQARARTRPSRGS